MRSEIAMDNRVDFVAFDALDNHANVEKES